MPCRRRWKAETMSHADRRKPRWLLVLFVGWLFGSCRAVSEFPAGKLVDLSYAFDETTIYWPTEEGFRLEKKAEGFSEKGYFYFANAFRAAEHGGTHVDAPRHFSEQGQTVDEIPLERLMGKGIVVDVSEACAKDGDYEVRIDDFLKWEKNYGKIPSETIVLLRTGSGKFWPDRPRYMGTDERGPEAVKKLHFPGLHPEAARWLVAELKIKAVGLDTPSIDYGPSTLFESHVALFEKNVPALENLANLDLLPPKDFLVVALPMKIKKGSGGPTRVVAVLP